jgi:trehalose 6-phosphate phosphatase
LFPIAAHSKFSAALSRFVWLAANLARGVAVQQFLPEEICLFLDVDGTLIDIAPRPQDVVVPPSLIGDIVSATQRLGGALALVSGRDIETIDRLFHPLRLCAGGVHGAELRLTGNGDVRKMEAATLAPELRRELEALAARFPGSIVEDKGASVALHYRFCADRKGDLQDAIEALLARQDDNDLTVMPGHFVFEVKHKRYDKGTALAAFMDTEAFHGRMPVVIGDDVTDEAAFGVALARGGYAFSVGRDVEGVSGRFDEPADVRVWLAKLARPGRPGESGQAGLAKAG